MCVACVALGLSVQQGGAVVEGKSATKRTRVIEYVCRVEAFDMSARACELQPGYRHRVQM